MEARHGGRTAALLHPADQLRYLRDRIQLFQKLFHGAAFLICKNLEIPHMRKRHIPPEEGDALFRFLIVLCKKPAQLNWLMAFWHPFLMMTSAA